MRFAPLSVIASTLFAVLALSGCSGIAKGVTEAVLERKQEDTRLCEIVGSSFDGVKDSVDHQDTGRVTKVLMVHGISKHLPDYSARFREKLLRSLDLDSMDATLREIQLKNKDGQSAGILRIRKYFSSYDQRSLIFYELTWSSIAEPQKEVIAFDSSEAYSYRRAAINKSLKSFMNQTVPDLLVYEGMQQPLINAAVGQSMCWMFSRPWDNLPEKGAHFCDPDAARGTNTLKNDDYFVVTHSLGSRITVDTFNNAVEAKKLKDHNNVVMNKTFTVFMMANQLPLLQVGHPKPATTGQIKNYCTRSGKLYNDRLVGKTQIVAFSDPNDILSYPLPPGYADEYVNSRLCPDIVNVDINVAQVSSVFGLDFANPLDAHTGYLEDDRVIDIISSGLDRDTQSPLITRRCHWTETTRRETANQEK